MATCEEIFGNSDESEEEFIGFTRSEIDPESDTESLGDSDISFSDSGSESSESEDENNAEEGDQWSRNLRNVAVAPFVKPTCPVNILPAESTALDFFNNNNNNNNFLKTHKPKSQCFLQRITHI